MADRRHPIPISSAKNIAQRYGYDQVVIYGRRVGDGPEAGEHLTAYGVTKVHCRIAAQISQTLKRLMGWNPDPKIGEGE